MTEKAPGFRVLVVDDEPPARSRLRRMLDEFDDVAVIGEAENGEHALSKAQSFAPDLVLLDIRMPGMDGLEAAHHLTRMALAPAIIFTTAYDQHALEAFEARALDYLLKPIRQQRLREAVSRALELRGRQSGALTHADINSREPLRPDGPRTHLSAQVAGSLRLVAVAEVRYLRADRKYVEAGYPGGELLLDEPLAGLEEELGAAFVRVHRNALVAVRYVSAINRTVGGGHVVELEGVGEVLDVSRRMVSTLRARVLE